LRVARATQTLTPPRAHHGGAPARFAAARKRWRATTSGGMTWRRVATGGAAAARAHGGAALAASANAPRTGGCATLLASRTHRDAACLIAVARSYLALRQHGSI